MSDKKQKLRLVDDPTAAERYANKVVGASFDGAACTITLGVTRLVPERVSTPNGKIHGLFTNHIIYMGCVGNAVKLASAAWWPTG